jgi:uncharacterized protein (UPF0333 family)
LRGVFAASQAYSKRIETYTSITGDKDTGWEGNKKKAVRSDPPVALLVPWLLSSV